MGLPVATSSRLAAHGAWCPGRVLPRTVPLSHGGHGGDRVLGDDCGVGARGDRGGGRGLALTVPVKSGTAQGETPHEAIAELAVLSEHSTVVVNECVWCMLCVCGFDVPCKVGGQ